MHANVEKRQGADTNEQLLINSEPWQQNNAGRVGQLRGSGASVPAHKATLIRLHGARRP